jgi:ElaB/YqjD/DUF883 family membrane-anchored ribosome-binding protein
MATTTNTNSGAGQGTRDTGDTYRSTRERTSAAYESTRSAVSDAARSVTGNPTAALAGGFIVGALVGALAPTTEKERSTLQPLGQKLSDAARDQARKAAEAGRDKMDQLTGQVVNKVGSAVVEAVAAKE